MSRTKNKYRLNSNRLILESLPVSCHTHSFFTISFMAASWRISIPCTCETSTLIACDDIFNNNEAPCAKSAAQRSAKHYLCLFARSRYLTPLVLHYSDSLSLRNWEYRMKRTSALMIEFPRDYLGLIGIQYRGCDYRRFMRCLGIYCDIGNPRKFLGFWKRYIYASKLGIDRLVRV